MSEAGVEWLQRPDGTRLAYRHHAGRAPMVVFLGGFHSAMSGRKAGHVERAARRRGQAVLCLDYSGHGCSGGRFEDGCVSRWAADAALLVGHFTRAPTVLVGASMGAWIMVLLATRHAVRVAGMIGLAAAPDFAADLLWQRLDDGQRADIDRDGITYLDSRYGDGPYPITARLLADARTQTVLDGPIELDCPVRLVHGLDDADVPWQRSLALAEVLAGGDVRLDLLKAGGHRLSEPPALEHLGRLLDELLDADHRSDSRV